MNIVFVHQNFPGQFKHVVPALAAEGGHRLVGFTMVKAAAEAAGLQTVSYQPGRGSTRGVHPWVSEIEAKVIRGEVAMKAARKMRDEYAFDPDLIFAHHGWGESLFLKEIWPQARMLLYSEWYYPLQGADFGFDAELQETDVAARCRLRMKNANNLLSLEQADAGVSPTRWQRDTHPAWFRDRYPRHSRWHRHAQRVPAAELATAAAADPRRRPMRHRGRRGVLTPGDEVVTFVNRNLEPYRGYHIFMRALPELLRRPPARARGHRRRQRGQLRRGTDRTARGSRSSSTRCATTSTSRACTSSAGFPTPGSCTCCGSARSTPT